MMNIVQTLKMIIMKTMYKHGEVCTVYYKGKKHNTK